MYIETENLQLFRGCNPSLASINSTSNIEIYKILISTIIIPFFRVILQQLPSSIVNTSNLSLKAYHILPRGMTNYTHTSRNFINALHPREPPPDTGDQLKKSTTRLPRKSSLIAVPNTWHGKGSDLEKKSLQRNKLQFFCPPSNLLHRLFHHEQRINFSALFICT